MQLELEKVDLAITDAPAKFFKVFDIWWNSISISSLLTLIFNNILSCIEIKCKTCWVIVQKLLFVKHFKHFLAAMTLNFHRFSPKSIGFLSTYYETIFYTFISIKCKLFELLSETFFLKTIFVHFDLDLCQNSSSCLPTWYKQYPNISLKSDTIFLKYDLETQFWLTDMRTTIYTPNLVEQRLKNWIYTHHIWYM